MRAFSLAVSLAVSPGMTMTRAPESTHRIDPGDRLLRIPGLRVVVVDGPACGLSLPVVGRRVRVGSAAPCQVVIADGAVSRAHCELELASDGVRLRDVGSLNGTWVGGVKIADATLPVGVLVTIGHSTFRLETAEEPVLVLLSARRSLGALVGGSTAMRSAYALLERAGSTTATVLLTGETGTGKDLAARAIHDLSVRAAGPFVPVDCSAIPEHLFESELFGHVRGAFTGAVASRRGVFEEANGGTLFLDEIGELPLALQAKLLRALETRTIRRVGASLPTPVDVRIIAATNRALLKQVNSGAFREDLYYRLAVLEIELPPLRDRRDDLPLLAQTLWARCGGTGDIPDHVVQHLCARDYPGNVRELRNHVERLVVLGLARRPGVTAVMAVAEERAGPATASSSAPLPPLHLPLKEARHAWMRGFEEIYVRAMFERHGGNLTHAAAAAGISRRSLQRIVIRLGLRGAEDEPDD